MMNFYFYLLHFWFFLHVFWTTGICSSFATKYSTWSFQRWMNFKSLLSANFSTAKSCLVLSRLENAAPHSHKKEFSPHEIGFEYQIFCFIKMAKIPTHECNLQMSLYTYRSVIQAHEFIFIVALRAIFLCITQLFKSNTHPFLPLICGRTIEPSIATYRTWAFWNVWKRIIFLVFF